MLFFQPAPKIIERIADDLILQACQPLSSEYHNVQSREFRLMSEGLANPAFNPVSLNSQFQIFFGENQTDPGMTEIIRCCQDQEIPVRNFQLYVIEDFAVISRS